MKNILFCLLFMSTMANAQFVNVPDPVLKALLLSADATNEIAFDEYYDPIRIDINNNNEIELTEAALVPVLYINATGISDLTGVKEFANLKEIGIYHGTFTVLDFSSMSQLNLITISETSVMNFNFSGASNVQTLMVYACNALTALDVRELTGLVTLITGRLIILS